MEATERQAVLILADISGYTKYMVANQEAAVHGQLAITSLIETLLAEVEIPLTLHAIEGDAIFLSASRTGEDKAWGEVLATVRRKLQRFFQVFLEAIVRTAETTPCACGSCRNLDELKLKIIVHSGRAVYHTIAGLAQISGTDVILAHRLLKNSVPSHEYLLMSDAAFRDLGAGMEGPFTPGEEDCEGIGRVKTWVKLMGEAREETREAFYAKGDDELAVEAAKYIDGVQATLPTAIATQWKNPAVKVPLLERIGFAVSRIVRLKLGSSRAKADLAEHLRRKRDARRQSAVA